jgi:hypothetical protein
MRAGIVRLTDTDVPPQQEGNDCEPGFDHGLGQPRPAQAAWPHHADQQGAAGRHSSHSARKRAKRRQPRRDWPASANVTAR